MTRRAKQRKQAAAFEQTPQPQPQPQPHHHNQQQQQQHGRRNTHSTPALRHPHSTSSSHHSRHTRTLRTTPSTRHMHRRSSSSHAGTHSLQTFEAGKERVCVAACVFFCICPSSQPVKVKELIHACTTIASQATSISTPQRVTPVTFHTAFGTLLSNTHVQKGLVFNVRLAVRAAQKMPWENAVGEPQQQQHQHLCAVKHQGRRHHHHHQHHHPSPSPTTHNNNNNTQACKLEKETTMSRKKKKREGHRTHKRKRNTQSQHHRDKETRNEHAVMDTPLHSPLSHTLQSATARTHVVDAGAGGMKKEGRGT